MAVVLEYLSALVTLITQGLLHESSQNQSRLPSLQTSSTEHVGGTLRKQVCGPERIVNSGQAASAASC